MSPKLQSNSKPHSRHLRGLLSSLLLIAACGTPLPSQTGKDPNSPLSLRLPNDQTTKGNSPPFIQSLTSQPRQVQAGSTVTLKAQGFDVESQNLTYRWTASRGTLIKTSGAEVQWKAEENGQPLDTGFAIVSVVVDDGQQAVKGDINILLENTQGQAAVDAGSVTLVCTPTPPKEVASLVLDQKLSPVFYEVPNIAAGRITIDGETHDWGGILPAVQDAAQDHGGSGDDIRTVYLAQDNDFLYYRIDTWNPPQSQATGRHLSLGETGNFERDPYPQAEEKVGASIEGKISRSSLVQHNAALNFYLTATISGASGTGDRTRPLGLISTAEVVKLKQTPVTTSQTTSNTNTCIQNVRIATIPDGQITIDGFADDWKRSGIQAVYQDPVGDGSAGIDLYDTYLAMDSKYLYLMQTASPNKNPVFDITNWKQNLSANESQHKVSNNLESHDNGYTVKVRSSPTGETVFESRLWSGMLQNPSSSTMMFRIRMNNNDPRLATLLTNGQVHRDGGQTASNGTYLRMDDVADHAGVGREVIEKRWALSDLPEINDHYLRVQYDNFGPSQGLNDRSCWLKIESPTQPQANGSHFPEPIYDVNDSQSLTQSQPVETESDDIPADYTNPVGMSFNAIPAGSYMMGALNMTGAQGPGNIAEPIHEVSLSSFQIQTTEVTQGQWHAIMGNGHWPERTPSNPNPNHPMRYVSWCDIVGENGDPIHCQGYNDSFLKKLNAQGHGTYRLPTEAEWEYAARAKTTTDYACGNYLPFSGNENNCPYNMGWFIENDEYAGMQTGPKAVGTKKPNAWGLYDMSGNVWEWTHDWFGMYNNEPESNPTGPEKSEWGDITNERVIRGGSWGGSWGNTAIHAFSANRNFDHPIDRHGDLGFRLVREQ